MSARHKKTKKGRNYTKKQKPGKSEETIRMIVHGRTNAASHVVCILLFIRFYAF